MYFAGKEPYWYNTIIAFPFGVLYSLYFKEINEFLKKKRMIPWAMFTISLVTLIVLFAIDYKIRTFSGLLFFAYYVEVIAFMVVILMFTYLFRFGNKVLMVLHGYTLWSYLLQNISFALFAGPANVAAVNKYLYFLCCFSFTTVLCFVFKFTFDFGWRHTLGKVRFIGSSKPVSESQVEN